MRGRILIAVLALAGCTGIADPSELRSPQSAAEMHEFQQQAPRVNRVVPPLSLSNRDSCGDRCEIWVGINIADGYQAFADEKQVYISTPLLRFMRNDAELALVIAHEWAHRLLGDTKPGVELSMTRELRADCVGAVMTFRAGYDLRLANQALRRMGWTLPGLMQAAFGGTTHPVFVDRANRIDRLADILEQRRAAGQSPTRATINELCGTAL